MKKPKFSKYSEIQKESQNPFLHGEKRIVSRTRKKFNTVSGQKPEFFMNMGTGVQSEGKMKILDKEIEMNNFVKLFKDEISSLNNLSKTGITVFGYFISKLEMNKDEVYLYMQDLMDYGRWDQSNQAYKGLLELVNADIIFPSVMNGWFYINPAVLFNGDRIKFLREYWEKYILNKPLPPDPLKVKAKRSLKHKKEQPVEFIPETEELYTSEKLVEFIPETGE